MKQNQKALENNSKTDTQKLTNRESLNCPIQFTYFIILTVIYKYYSTELQYCIIKPFISIFDDNAAVNLNFYKT